MHDIELTPSKQVHFRYWSPGIKTTVHDRLHHDSAASQSFVLSIYPKQGIHQQNLHTRFILFHRRRQHRLGYALGVR